MSTVKGLQDTIKWYDENAANYANAAKDLYFLPAIDKFVSLLPEGGSVLDAGCGSGRDSSLLKSSGFKISGVDISEGLLEQAKKQNQGIEFIKGDLLDLPFSDNSFDGVWSHASLVHLETPEDTQKAIREFHRVLHTGGIVHIFVKEKLTDDKTAVVSDKLSNHERFFQYYLKEEIIKMLEDAGFSIEFIKNNIDDPAGREDTKWIWVLAKKSVE